MLWQASKSGQATERKLRLFACGCARQVWHLLGDARSRNAVEVAEAHADGVGFCEQLRAAEAAAEEAYSAVEQAAQCAVAKAHGKLRKDVKTALAAAAAARVAARTCAARTDAFFHTGPVGGGTEEVDDLGLASCRWAFETLYQGQHNLVRELFGPTLFRPVFLDPSWRTASARTLATGIYDGHDFAAMPVLADALEEAGCTDPTILDHCRQLGEHIRGCWALDRILELR
jgi:hypothetical protein